MQYHYLNKDGLYLYVQNSLFEEYQDYCDVNAMLTQHYVFLKTKDNVLKFLMITDAERYLILNKRKLKDVVIKKE